MHTRDPRAHSHTPSLTPYSFQDQGQTPQAPSKPCTAPPPVWMTSLPSSSTAPRPPPTPPPSPQPLLPGSHQELLIAKPRALLCHSPWEQRWNKNVPPDPPRPSSRATSSGKLSLDVTADLAPCCGVMWSQSLFPQSPPKPSLWVYVLGGGPALLLCFQLGREGARRVGDRIQQGRSLLVFSASEVPGTQRTSKSIP